MIFILQIKISTPSPLLISDKSLKDTLWVIFRKDSVSTSTEPFYSTTSVNRALLLVNLTSTICPCVYAADRNAFMFYGR